MERAGSGSPEWAGSRDLHVELPPRGGRRVALERALRAAIRDGRLRAGDRLPSTRALAADLGLARGTVAAAYAQLTAEGYLTARPGAPTRVAFGGVELESGDAVATPVATPRLDLAPGTPDVGSFPRAAWLRALRRGFAAAPDSVLGYRDLRGRPELRAALAGYLGRARGVLADPDRIVVCSGFNEGLALLLAALPGATLAIEDPCLHFHRLIAAGAGRRIVPMAVDEHGARPVEADAALLTPAHQFPLGATLAPDRRAAFVRWARERRTVVIEDDYDGEFRYDRQPAGALQGLDPEHVVYAGTTSKTLAPGLRLAWLVLPGRLVEPVLEAKLRIGGTTVIEQLALAELISSGALDRHVRRMRTRYRDRRDALLSLLEGRRTRGIAAGLHLVVDVADEASVIAAGAREGVVLQGLETFWHARGASGLVVGYAAPPQHAYTAALDALGRALREASA